MPLGKQVATFSLQSEPGTYTRGSDNTMTAQINMYGSQSGEMPGAAFGTLTVMGIGAKSGTWSWCGATYLDTGDTDTDEGNGTWETTGPHKWRLRGIDVFSDGRTAVVEAEGDLASQTLTGTLYELS